MLYVGFLPVVLGTVLYYKPSQSPSPAKGDAYAAFTRPRSTYGLPIEYRNCAVRKKMCPSEIAGELNV
jgi:hypothetical protein